MPLGVTTLQRGRLLVAVVEVVEEVGYANLSVSRVIARAGVSRKTFYDVFANREECFLVAFEQAVERASRLAVDAYARQTSWRDGIRAALASILALMEQERGPARLCVVETLGAGAEVLQFRADLLRKIARMLDGGRRDSPPARDPPAITAEAVTGGIVSVLHSRLCEEPQEPLSDLLGALMSMIVLPYLGTRAAGQELNKQRSVRLPEEPGRVFDAETDPRQSIRLTDRAVRTLMVIAERPGASNRGVADGAGITDQGQISKLLNRLSGLGLIENYGSGQSKGGPNAWRLTRRGERLRRAAWSR
jgi:AcrR family transcriptional regulator